jgi:hypothetical protein
LKGDIAMSEYASNYTNEPTTAERAAALGAAVPQDHRDADDRTAVIAYKGETYVVDFAKWSFEVMDNFERGLNMKAFRLVFDDEQFDRMKTKLNFFDDYEAFLTLIQKARTAGK